MYCKHCGQKLEEDSIFCTKCGMPVQQQEKKTKSGKRNQNKKKIAKPLVLAVTLAVVVTAAGIGCKIYMEKGTPENREKQQRDLMTDEEKRIQALAEEEARGKDALEARALAEAETEKKAIAEAEAKEKAEAEADTWTDPETGLTRIRGGHTNKKYGYVNEKGEDPIPPVYDTVSEPGENGLICAEQMVATAFSEKPTGFTYFYNEKGEKVYDYVRAFEGRLSTAVREGSEYFIIDRQGRQISKNSYTYADEADMYGNFIVTKGTDLGLVNAEGKEIIKPQDIRIMPIDRMSVDRDGVYLVMGNGASLIVTDQGEIQIDWQEGHIEKVSIGQQRYQINLGDGTTEIRDFDGNVIVSREYASVILYPNGCIQNSESSAVYDPNGQEILPQQNEKGYLQTVDCFSSDGIGAGIVYTRGIDEYRSKKGMITLDGKITLPCVYDSVFYVPDKQVIIYSKEKKVGAINLECEILWEQAYDYAFVFLAKDKKNTEDSLLVKRGEYYGLVDMLTGEVILECRYSMISKDSQVQDNWFCSRDGEYGFWNQKDGTYTEIPNKDNYIIDGFHMGSEGEVIDVYGYGLGKYLKVRNGTETGVIDRQGKSILDPFYTEIYYDEYEEIFYVHRETETGIYDKNGNIVVMLDEYEVLEGYSDSIFVKPQGEEASVLDYKGNTVISQEACPESFFELGYIRTYQDGEYRFHRMDNGEFQKIEYSWMAPDEVDGIICVQNGEGKYGYINADGEEIIPCIFTNAYRFWHGLAVVMDEEEEWGAVNLQGDMLIDCAYEELNTSYAPNIILAKEYGYWGAFSLGGECILDTDYEEIQVGNMGTITALEDSYGEWDYYDYNGNLLQPYSYE